MTAMRERNPKMFRYILIGAVVLLLLCLVGALIWNIATTPVEEIAENPPVATTEATEVAAEDGAEADEEAAVTPTPTRVIDAATPEPTEEADETPTPAPTASSKEEVTGDPTAVPTTAANTDNETTTTTVIVSSVEAGPPEEIIQNGSFEDGFASNGVGLSWAPFKSDDITVVYSGEGGPGPYVDSGASAQRITTLQAGLGDRYTGIYQQLEVIPDEPYMLEMKGQIRTGFGDVSKSSFGYRMQYAISQRGVQNWQVVPEAAWIELPWDEQLLNSPDTEFMEYTTEFVPTAEEITLFIRTWNKWADPGEAHFTIDSVSLVGPSVVRTETAIASVDSAAQEFTPGEGSGTEAATTKETEGDKEAMVEQGLPTTGANASEAVGFTTDGRFWGALVVLGLLAIGATYRAKWSH